MILVTGGTGLVGSHLLLELAQQNRPIKATYRTQSSIDHVRTIFSFYTDKNQDLFDSIIWVKADILDIPALEEAFIDVTHVYHCAALISFDPSDYGLLKKINVIGTANIVNLSIAHKIKKLAYVSTIGTIAKSNKGEQATEENEWKDSQVNVYALTKFRAELEVWRASQEGLDVVIINPGVIVGPGFWNSGSGKLFSTANKEYNFYPPGGTGFIGVTDVVAILTKLMDSTIVNERFITVTDNLSYKEILSLITTALDKKAPSKQLKFWQLHLLRYGDWLLNLITRNGRKITKDTIHSLEQREWYSMKKFSEEITISYTPLKNTIAQCAKLFTAQTS